MKHHYLVMIFTLVICLPLYGGGILTNTNQSAMYTRIQVRDATLGIDAVYFNPAGVSLLTDGFYISLNNQSVFQTRTISTDYQYINRKKYIGDVSAVIYPGIYAAFKKGNFAVSAGLNPIGGGGGGIYNDGLPSFEYNISDLVPGLSAQGQNVTGYNAVTYFEGSAVYMGYQANISYKINDFVSVGIGGRYVAAKEAYNGYLKNIMITHSGKLIRADAFFTQAATDASNGAAMATGAASNLQKIVDGGGGTLTFDQAEAMGIITATEKAQLNGGLSALGIDPSGMNVSTAQSAFSTAAATLTHTATQAGAKALLLADQEADYEKKANGFTPIFSLNISPSDNLNIAIKYEHRTKLEFANNTKKDFTVGFNPADGKPITMFPDGKKSRLDLPSQLVAGLTFKPSDKLLISTGIHYYFDKQADWDDRQKKLDNNFMEFAAGLEYSISSKLLISSGLLITKNGATGEYQNDLSQSMSSRNIGFGGAYKLNDKVELNLGASYTFYKDDEKSIDHDLAGSGNIVKIKETYDRDIWIFAIGLNFAFGLK